MQRKAECPIPRLILIWVALAILTISLFYYWFRIANRSIVFLYEHDMGPLYPDTGPFSYVTRSRYWMAGMVVGGCAWGGYAVYNLFARLLNKSYIPCPWHKVLLIPTLCSLIGIPLITMLPSPAPSLPLVLAFQVSVVTVAALFLAISAATIAGENPGEFILLCIDGTGVALLLIGAAGLEHIQEWQARDARHLLFYLGFILIAGFSSLALMTFIRKHVRHLPTEQMSLFITGLCIAYPGMSAIHHFLFSGGYFYITDGDNFFARNIPLQASIWIVTWLLCIGISQIRYKLMLSRTPNKVIENA
ncbi:MAG: hypothetical protein P1S60_12945 [Anaerolineae bacterium]|nr:hypothetical protein [Anaerolineae bacterium]